MFQLTGAGDRVAVVRVPDRHGQPHVVASRARQPALLGRQRHGVDLPQVVDSGGRR
jgi:hypothetical protein